MLSHSLGWVTDRFMNLLKNLNAKSFPWLGDRPLHESSSLAPHAPDLVTQHDVTYMVLVSNAPQSFSFGVLN